MDKFLIENSDSKMLWIVWLLMRTFSDKKVKKKNAYGTSFFYFPFRPGIEPVYGEKILINYLCEKNNIIDELLIDLYEPTVGEDPVSYAVGSIHLECGKKISDDELERLHHYDLWGYWINLGYDRAKAFVDYYIHKWQQGEFKHHTDNLLEFGEQCRRIKEEINQLLKKGYIKKNLHISSDFDIGNSADKVDFIAVILFLEQNGFFEIVEIKPIQKKIIGTEKIGWSAVINIKDKFYSEFPGSYLGVSIKESQSEIKGVEVYNGVITDFNEGKISFGKGHKSKFSNSRIRKLWRLVLTKKGKVFSYNKIASSIGLAEKIKNNRANCVEIIAQTKKNLIARLARLGIESSEVSSWFIDNDGYGLKMDK